MSDADYANPSQRYLAAIGALAVNWALIEAMLDFSIAIVRKNFPYRNMEDVPLSLKGKIRSLRKGLKHRALLINSKQSEALLDDIMAHKDERHSVLHSAIMGAPNGDQIATLRIRYAKDRHDTSVESLTSERIESYAATALRLGDRLVSLSAWLFNEARPDEAIQYPLREFGP